MGEEPKRYSLKAQIAEVERELGQRAKVYPRLVSSRAMSQGEADMHTAIMRSTLATLQWLEQNEGRIKAASGTDRELWDALRMVREAIEMHAPPGTLPAGQHTGVGPLDEAEALVKAIVVLATAHEGKG